MRGIKAKTLAFTQSIIPLSTFKHKLKNFLLYVALLICFSETVLAAEVTSKDFLALPEAHQKFWIQGAMDVLIQIAAAKSTEQGQCVADWYFSDKQAQRNSLIIASMKKYPAYTPRIIFVALTEKACGSYRK